MRKIAVMIGILSFVILMLAGCRFVPPDTSLTNTQTETEAIDSAPEEATVEITATGFSPATITLPAGGRVTWINKDSTRHWPASAVHPTHEVYPQSTGACPAIGGSDFDTCKELQQGEEYSFVFTERGSWRYHDHLRPSFTGTVVVE